MIKQWKNKQFERWAITRKKGQLNYVLKQTLIIGGAVLFGGFIGYIVFDKIRTWEEYWLDFYVQISALLVFGLIINYFMWIISETIYEKECKKRRLLLRSSLNLNLVHDIRLCFMKDPDIEFHKWKNERKRGMISYMTRSSSLALFGLLVGHILAGFIFPSSVWYLSSIQESAIYITIAIGVLIPISLISWFLRERKYQKHLSKLKRT